jgi:hypothetical protein
MDLSFASRYEAVVSAGLRTSALATRWKWRYCCRKDQSFAAPLDAVVKDIVRTCPLLDGTEVHSALLQ